MHSKMKKILILLCLVLSSSLLSGQSTGRYYFFSQPDVENMKNSTNTTLGKSIIDSLKNLVEERLKHPMEVPMLEGGHLHQYYCPIHNMFFRFDWDKPTSHYCEQCEKYWDKDVRFNWAWVNVLHYKNMDFLDACAYLYIATGDDRYAKYIKDLMLDYSLKYPTYMLHDIRRNQIEHQSGKMYAQSLEEAVFSSYASRAYLVAKSVMSDDEVTQIEEGYLKPCAKLLLNQKMKLNFWDKYNWYVWHNSGLLALGIALANDSIVNVALNDPQQGYHKLMKQYVFDDGWWCEGSPHYHFYPLRAMLLSAEAVRCYGINLYEEKFYKMFVAPALSVYANLQFPSHNDGFYGETLQNQIGLYEIAALRFNDDFLKDVLAEVYQSNVKRNSLQVLQSNLDYSNRKITSKRQTTNFPVSGIGVMRSGDKTVILKYGPHENSHGHPDKLSITIHDGKKEIISDLGTTAYGVPDYRRWYRRTLPHSTLSVDAKDQKPSAGKLVKFETNANGGLIEANANEAHEGVLMNRKLTLKGNKLTDIFTAESDDEHTYDLMLMLTEKPSFTIRSVSTELNDSEVYKCIRNVKKIVGKKSISLMVDGHRVNIKSLTNDSFDVFLGEAPGISFSRLLQKKNNLHCQSVAYPLIVRIKSSDMKIETTWNLK